MRTKVITVLTALAAVTATLAAPAAVAAPDPQTTEKTRVTRVPGTEGVYQYTGGDYRAQAWDDCRSGTCFWTEFEGVGHMWTVPSCGRHNVPGDFNDRLSSVWNKTSSVINIFQDANQGGYLGPVPPGWRGNLHPAHNERMSSVDAVCI
ncbi:peptidase inhibitor family I36 protein [Streptomyces sp. URMC 123]|uniref:peptidase inhibitor family I36 protein n=1 Tax=Streptomyces sp. URMC 123 TaxID=3423403 RepID=UPI003F1B1150